MKFTLIAFDLKMRRSGILIMFSLEFTSKITDYNRNDPEKINMRNE